MLNVEQLVLRHLHVDRFVRGLSIFGLFSPFVQGEKDCEIDLYYSFLYKKNDYVTNFSPGRVFSTPAWPDEAKTANRIQSRFYVHNLTGNAIKCDLLLRFLPSTFQSAWSALGVNIVSFWFCWRQKEKKIGLLWVRVGWRSDRRNQFDLRSH